ncbi:1-phosphatidylinositol 4,5-bisphosphate phosphodiesterase eta-1 [Callorhinchus milii]|uniref:1-phosphatidylinositol 4,5-bisphosphate phosphodiesterase eta-1 n=1 Tax=Callorhinchus milii TaxID=7868 RepID=UPI001C3F7E14|nr:1-phosphatidylinositol 4,5-bisphosphate phosphodiesterase eta-1 [Callorhinchus milii]
MNSWVLKRSGGQQYCRHFLAGNGVFHVERCMGVMQSGTQMVKLKSGSKGLVRLFYLDEHRTCIRWRPSRKNEKAKITIDSISKVLEGRQSENFNRHTEGSFEPSCCFSIYHGNHMEALDLVTSNPEDARTWITGLKYLMAGIKDEDSLAKRQRTHDQWMKQTFEEADKNGDGLLSIEEIYQLMHKLNVNLPRRKIRQMFQEADTDDKQGTLNFEEFCVFYKMMSLRRDLFLLLKSYSDKKDHLTLEEVAVFLNKEQKMANVTLEYCMDIVEKFEVSEENKQQNVLGIEGFTDFMRSPAADIFNASHYELNQDMDQPLCNYFIASSHNTYLTGDQLLSQSKVDMYSWVLQAGCRCVEVDCWDGPDGEPIVQHGYTLTSKVLFKDVVETIDKYAFIKNEYPVILSIENHCSIQQQQKIAGYLKDILGDKLDLSSIQMSDPKQFPTPQSLRGKILIKGKKLAPDVGADEEEGEVSDEDSADEIEEDCKLEQINSNGTNHPQMESFIRKKLDFLLKESQIRDKEDPDSYTVCALLRATHEGLNMNLQQKSEVKENVKKNQNRSFISSFSKHKKSGKSKAKSHTPEEDEVRQDCTGKETGQSHRMGRRRKTMKLCRGLSDLVVYTNSVTSQDILGQGTAGNILSLSETRAHQLLQQKPEQFMNFNQKQLTRVYPSAYRIDSSNFNPQPYWNVGCQMVALNYQTDGRMMQLNQALFMVNGNSGYVLKPQLMCQGAFNPFSEDPLQGQPKKQLILKIISGQQLPKPPYSMLGDRGEIIDPFVEVEIIGLPVDCCKEQTRAVDDNGFNPVWEETMTFTVHMPEVTLVRFLVWDHDPIGRDFVGQRTVAFSSLMPGYRHVYLEGMTEASIFVHVMIHDIYGKTRQLLGLKGLFNKSPKYSFMDNNCGYFMRKKSLGNRILRRTASAPAKGRKKSKSLLLETLSEAKEQEPDLSDSQEKGTRAKRDTKKTQARPVSMPVDKLLDGDMSPPAGEMEDDRSEVKLEPHWSKQRCADELLVRPPGISPHRVPLTSSDRDLGSHSQELTGNILEALAVNSDHSSPNIVADNCSVSVMKPCNGPIANRSVKPDEMRDRGPLCKSEELRGEDVQMSIEHIAIRPHQEPSQRATTSISLCFKAFVDVKEKHEPILSNGSVHDITIASNSTIDLSSTVSVHNLDTSQSLSMSQDCTISHLINAMSLSNESGVDNSISVLISQFEATDDQTTVSSFLGANNCTFSSVSGLSEVRGSETIATMDPLYRDIKAKKQCLNTTTDTTIFSSPETAEHSTYTIIHDDILSPLSFYAAEDARGGMVDVRQGNALYSPSMFPSTPIGSGVPTNLCVSSDREASWGSLDDCSLCHSTTSSVASEDTIINMSLNVDSVNSSLMEVNDLEVTLMTTENYVDDQDPEHPPATWDLYPTTRPGGINGSDHWHLEKVPALDADDKAVYRSPKTGWNQLRSVTSRTPSEICSIATANQSSTCKSKSLGDLTSEDITCTFESKYKFISKGFIAPGIKDRELMSSLGDVPQPAATLTEQLRKLVSMEQEENHERDPVYRGQEHGNYQKGLIRKLSSRSQSRVRYIANRAKQIQEANKHRLANGCSTTGVVFRNKPPIQHHTVNRHSTGSYIAGYLNQLKEEKLEGRGIPEGSCTSLHHRYTDSFYTDDSTLQPEPNSVSEPEIYFLLRL